MDAVDDNITILIAFATPKPQDTKKTKKKYQHKVRKILINRMQAAVQQLKNDNNAIEVNDNVIQVKRKRQKA